mmetsp:Transcript_88831/g.236515  ORF Transcript_88831/g.236515 Transcript_88831/m.236515 type:complete len:373 (+) Transcript_88831:216-1334(+)
MPLVRTGPRCRRRLFHFRVLERAQMLRKAMLWLLMDNFPLRVLEFFCLRKIIKRPIVMVAVLLHLLDSSSVYLDSAQALIRMANMPRTTVYYPFCRDSEMLRFSDDIWDSPHGCNMFLLRFRFRREHFIQLAVALELVNLNDGQFFRSIRVGQPGHYHVFPSDVCLMVLLRRLSSPCRFADLVNEFYLPSHRICEIFHAMIDLIFIKFAYRLSDPKIWTRYFTIFADRMKAMGAPFDSLVGLIDGNFLQLCRPLGLGNFRANVDLQEYYYSGKEKCHGIKFLALLFPNGMVAIAGPSCGRVHDARMLRESGWMQMLYDYEQRTGRTMFVFGDAAFPCNRYCQSMRKGVLTIEERAFNSLMSRIRIQVSILFI